jgi:hypothetical protein
MILGAADRFEFLFGSLSLISGGLALGALQRQHKEAAATVAIAALLPFAFDALSSFTEVRRPLAHVGPVLLAAASLLGAAAALFASCAGRAREVKLETEELHIPRVRSAHYFPSSMSGLRGSCSCGWQGPRRRRRSVAIEDIKRHMQTVGSWMAGDEI